MMLKAIAIAVVFLIGTSKVLSGDIDDDVIWERLIKGVRNDSRESLLPNLDETENLDLLENDLNSLSENGSTEFIQVDTKQDNEITGENIDVNMKSDINLQSLEPSIDRVSREPNVNNNTYQQTLTEDTYGIIKGVAAKPKPGQASLVIIFDGTGSMLDDLKQLQKGAKDIIEEITKRENNPIYNYIFIPFRDPDYGPIINTINQNELLKALEDVELMGGGDCPESSISGINAGLDIALSKSFVYIFTDAIAQDFKMAEETIKMIQEKQITLTFLLTGFCNSKQSEGYYVYETLAAISNGQVYNLQKTDIKDVLESIKQFLDANMIPISYVYSEGAGSQSIELDVSKNLKEFTVSLAGDKPNITVIDPNKEQYAQQRNVLNLESLKIVNVQDPQPGKWNVHTQSESEHSVKLTAISDIFFKFGFSPSNPGSLADTEINPIKNVQNFLAISPSNNSLLHNLTAVDIILFNAKDDPEEKRQTQINLPLKKAKSTECDTEYCLYITKAFPPPLSLFKIYVNGFDSDGNPLRNLLSTAIQAIDGDVPRVHINESFIEVTEEARVNIYCKVISETPVAVHWIANQQLRDAVATSEKNLWKYELESAKTTDAGKYICNARNVHGADKGQITVIVKEKIIPLQVKMVDSNMISTENDTDYQISCFIRPRQKATIEWFFNDTKIKSAVNLEFMTLNDNLVITQVRRNHSGRYTCVASNKREIQNATGYLDVFYEPQIIDEPREDRVVRFGDSITLDCHAIGNPTPKIEWHRENLSQAIDGSIVNFKPMDQGLYLCEASNGIGKAAWKEIYLEGSAKDPPRIVPPANEKIEVKVGDELYITCKCSSCGPVYNYKWSKVTNSENGKNEQVISGVGPTRDDYTKSFQYDLHLKNLNASDDGYYICEIGNEHGLDKISVHVNVLDKPHIKSLSSSSQINDDMIKINQGGNVRIECTVQGSPIPDIHWYKDDIGIVPSSNVYSSKHILLIKNISASDMGAYKCVASNALGTASKEVLLYVVVPPTFSLPKDIVITAEEGQNVRILCDVFAMPFPDIKWSFNNMELNLTDNRYILLGGELSFVAQYADNGMYACKASNEAGDATMQFGLIVFVPPSINPDEDNSLSVRIQHNITLTCKTEGFPIPDIKWTFDGNELINASNAYLLSGGDLLLVNVTPQMVGPYICHASNRIGEKQRTTFLAVTEPPKVLSHFDSFINLTVDASFSLICAAKGIPQPDIFWAKDGEKYTDGPQQQYLEVTFGKTSSGNYTCIAQSPEGADTKTVYIAAIEPPRLVDIQAILRTKINVTEGELLEITCPFTNAKKVTWYKDDLKFHAESKDAASTSLHLPAATLNDRGIYTCIAENEAGSRNFTQEIKILAAPRIVANDVIEKYGDATQIPEVTVEAGENLEITCPMEGFPIPKVKWMKDTTLISREPDLLLKNVQPFHDGRYDCEARNDLGSADYSYIVKVLSPPTTHLPKHTRKEVNEGANLDLECSFLGSPPPKTMWTRNDLTLTDVPNRLHLENVQPKDKGVYKCVGANDVGSDEISYTIDILELPKFTFINDDIKILESEDLMLRCAARGNPVPIVVWTYNGQMILGSSKIPRNVEQSYGLLELDESGSPIINGHPNDVVANSSVATENGRKNNLYGKVYFDKDSVSLMLIIKSRSQKLPGSYTCHAVNAMGSEQKDVNVRVLIPPQLHGREIDKQPVTNLTLLSGLPLILLCPWHGEPLPKIEWYKYNASIKDDSRKQISHDSRTLTILASETNDSGEYHCHAINYAGSGRKQFNIDILSPPHFRIGNPTENRINDESERLMNDPAPRQALPGERIIFECPVSGNPMPQVFWLESTFGVINATKILDATTARLVLDNIEKTATYTCYANNSLGFIEKRYEVLVLKTPEIRSMQPRETVFEHRTISLHCPIVAGSPRPDITWFKDGKHIQENSKHTFLSQDKVTLKILNAKKEDSGLYTCKAINLAGQQEKDINVTVINSVVWSEWNPWSTCSQTCGAGVSTRMRRCTRLNGDPTSSSDEPCIGRNFESKTCEISPCPINGGWSPWSNWTSCSKPCWNPKDKYRPTMKRYRECNSPYPSTGGRPCSGSDYEEAECSIEMCTINGGWSSWTVWSPCSVSCGSGFATRYRKCDNPIPLHGGNICIGSALESQVCYAGPCPIHGGWTEWSVWSECSQTCGEGHRKRKRICSNPEPLYGGLYCLGDNVEVAKCHIRNCENVDFLKSLNQNILYKPVAEYESKTIYNTKDSTKYVSHELDDGSYDYATGSNSYSTPLVGYPAKRTTTLPDEEQGTHVVVKVEKLTPIDKDTTQINFHPGLAPIMIKTVQPCDIGFQLDSSGSCIDVDECILARPCGSNQICINSFGSYACSCQRGYTFNEQLMACEDIDECADINIVGCSDECKNTPGSFTCICPTEKILSQDLKSCVPLRATIDDFEMSDPAAKSLELLENCLDGYYISNGSCHDIDECLILEDDCNIDQTCLNTKGSYLCIPTSCPEDYTRDEITRQCVLMCSEEKPCPKGAKISQTLSYTLLTLETITQSEPFLKVVNYDVNRIPLPETKFFLETETNPSHFRLVTMPFRKGIAYLYGSNKIRKGILYNVKIQAFSYDSKNVNLLYATKFIIYLYVI